MKKLMLFSVAICISFLSNAQAVSDNATIPLSVTLNTILRLNVTSGGNIEFAFNTIDDYKNGIANSSRYTTTFTVASSNNFNVDMQAEDANFIGTDDGTNHTMALSYVDFLINGGTGTIISAKTALAQNQTIVTTGLAGDITTNTYTINWSCGETTTILGAGIDPDRYTTNIALILSNP